MPRYAGDADFRHDSTPTTGVLLSNLGTPAAPTSTAVRRYLAEFLWDPRVVDVPRPIWWLVLHGFILRTRPRQSAKAYAKVWTDEGSPLLVNTMRQRDGLASLLDDRVNTPLHIEVGMRYAQPSIASALERLAAANCTRLLVLPLYPQYSATTTASTFDEVNRQLEKRRRVPALHFIDGYHDNPAYIDALAASIREHRAGSGRTARLLLSFHGIPKRYLQNGDPYHCLCHKTARLVAEKLQLGDDDWAIAFQSRLGREEWLRPYTDELLPEWAKSGVTDVDVVCPGFAADCLETLEEVALRYRALFLDSGGSSLTYIPALNDRADHIRCLAAIVERALSAWDPGDLPETEPARTLTRARHLGAQK
ncbi:MAG: ferrochelatase [Gammaproteobacteria bacterium]|nr:ferrochelatase [Gammaproteobacteria bacterium]MDH3767686.1 ferrochelatase [Gammaproteobacteria bacterium]MDH3806643.1 ferrochelatase [Gammaproteobacteria bacterium]